MKIKYTYEFANGDKTAISVDQSDFEILTEFDRQERNSNQTEKRRHISLDAWNAGENLLNSSEDTSEIFLANERQKALEALIQSALKKINPKYRDLIEQVFFDERKLADIARAEGVHKSTITRRLNRSLKKLKKLFEK